MTSRKIQRLAAAAAVLGLVASGAALTSAPATASAPRAADAEHCSGSLIENIPVAGGAKYGALAVYYDSSTGKNCARLNHGSETWDKAMPTEVYLKRCKERKEGKTCTYDTAKGEYGNFTEYAGPVRVKARNHCIHAYGYIVYKSTIREAMTKPQASHC